MGSTIVMVLILWFITTPPFSQAQPELLNPEIKLSLASFTKNLGNCHLSLMDPQNLVNIAEIEVPLALHDLGATDTSVHRGLWKVRMSRLTTYGHNNLKCGVRIFVAPVGFTEDMFLAGEFQMVTSVPEHSLEMDIIFRPSIETWELQRALLNGKGNTLQTVFIINYNMSRSDVVLTGGKFVCGYCGNPLTWRAVNYGFSCSQSGCFEAMMGTWRKALRNGNAIIWSFGIGEQTFDYERLLEQPSPFQRNSPVNLKSTVALYVSQQMDMSVLVKLRDRKIPTYYLRPRLLLDHPETGYENRFGSMFIREKTLKYSVITPEGVFKLDHGGSGDMMIFMFPFHPEVWFSIVLTVIGIAVISCLLVWKFDKRAFWEQFWRSLLTAVSIFLEQPCIGKIRGKKIGSNAQKRMLMFWAVGALILCRAYLGVLRSYFNSSSSVPHSEYTTQVSFNDRWSLRDFKLFLLVPDKDCTFIRKIIGGMPLQELRGKGEYSTIRDYITSNSALYPPFSKLMNERERRSDYKVYLACRSDIKRIVKDRNDFGHPIAFVINSAHCSSYWQLFRNFMVENPGTLFGHDCQIWRRGWGNEEYPQFVTVSSVLNQYQDGPLKRLKVSFESGLFGLWERWDLIRFPLGGEHPPRGTTFGELHGYVSVMSLNGSLFIVLYVIIFGMIFSAVVFGLEVGPKLCRLAFWRLNRLKSHIRRSCNK